MAASDNVLKLGDSMGKSIEIFAQQDERLNILIDDPNYGSTDEGWGCELNVTLDKEAIAKLKEFLNRIEIE